MMSPISVNISITDPTADEANQIAALIGATSVGANSGAPASDFVKAGPLASYDGATIEVVNGEIIIPDGAPNTEKVLFDKNGTPYAFALDASGAVIPHTTSPHGFDWTAAGVVQNTGSIIMTIRRGDLYYEGDNVSSSGGHTLYWYKAGGGLTPVSLPDPLSATPPAPPPMPSGPTPVSPAPGSTVNVVPVSTTLADAIAAAVAGDAVSVASAAAFAESVDIPLALELLGGGSISGAGAATATVSTVATLDGASLVDPTGYAHKLGGFVPMTDAIIDGWEITGFGLQETIAGGTAAVRNGAVSNFVVRDSYIHDCQNGIFSGGFNATALVENCLIKNNGLGDGRTHNIYVSAGVVMATFNSVTSIVAPKSANANRATGMMNGGHAVKSRANVTTINGGYFYASDATPIDIPDGSNAVCVITGATIEKKAGDANHGVLGYGVESEKNGIAGVKFIGCTFILNCDAPFIQTQGPVDFDASCVFQGTKPSVSGSGLVTGL